MVHRPKACGCSVLGTRAASRKAAGVSSSPMGAPLLGSVEGVAVPLRIDLRGVPVPGPAVALQAGVRSAGESLRQPVAEEALALHAPGFDGSDAAGIERLILDLCARELLPQADADHAGEEVRHPVASCAAGTCPWWRPQ